jgi:hypothetical protein
VTLTGQKDAVPTIAPSGDTPGGGFVDLGAAPFNIAPQPLNDEEAVNLNVGAFKYGGKTFNRIGVVSDGYVVVGGADSAADISFEPQHLPNPAPPNNVLAPFWTDLNGGNYRAGVLTNGVGNWLVIQIEGNIYGTTFAKGMQVWLQLGDTEQVSYEFDDATLTSTDTNGQDVTTGAENASGTAGDQIDGLPQGSLAVTTTPGEPGESLTYTVTVLGKQVGTGILTTTMVSDIVAGTTIVQNAINVAPR